jgi:hypothetical protein
LKHDKDFDGGSARDEWTKREPTFKDNDTANDGFLSYKELRGECGGPEKTMVAPLPKENSKRVAAARRQKLSTILRCLPSGANLSATGDPPSSAGSSR